MAEPRPTTPVLLVVAVFTQFEEALNWAGDRLETAFGPVGLASFPFPFVQTNYYTATMGPHLRKQFLAFADLVDPACLTAAKLRTNALEHELALTGQFPVPRPINLDPGMLGLGKFILATTKDQAHRIYLRDGIFAEVTLRYQAGAFVPWEWTYADYRLPSVREFLLEARTYYRGRLRDDSSPKPNASPP
jgi:hypothetical protein